MDGRIEKALFFIAKNFRTVFALEDLAQEIGMSKFHFHRLFKAETASTPLLYINKLKLEHAAHFLMMYPDSKQLEIAFESGYSSPVVFARVFKQFYGMSPMNYRKEKLGEKKVAKQQYKRLAQLDITYLKKKKVYVSRSNLTAKSLSSLYNNLVSKIEHPTYSIGFYIDAPFHKSLEECRYFAGLSEEQTNNEKLDSNIKSPYFYVDEGYYTYFNVQGPFEKVNEEIIAYKEIHIDPSPYKISSFIAVEKIKLLHLPRISIISPRLELYF